MFDRMVVVACMRLKQGESCNLLGLSQEMSSGCVGHQPSRADAPKVIRTVGLQFTHLLGDASCDFFHPIRGRHLAALNKSWINTYQRLVRTKASCQSAEDGPGTEAKAEEGWPGARRLNWS